MSDTDRYGFARSSWTWCWRCRQAIALEELATTARYHAENGWSHASCPPAGTAPRMPATLERTRAEAAQPAHPDMRRWWDES